MTLVTIPEPLDVAEFLRTLPADARVFHSQPADDSFRVLGVPPVDFGTLTKEDVVLVPADPLQRLRVIVELLLSPAGCPWDREQTAMSLRHALLNEAYEVIEAIESGEDGAIREELGDLLLQPVLQSAIASRRGAFDLNEVANDLAEKLIRRHPHVFGDLVVSGTAEVMQNWRRIKQEEGRESRLDGVPRVMPALSRALEISKRAAAVGFEWRDRDGVWAKLDEEKGELEAAILGGDQDAIESEVGDLLFTAVNLARWSGVDPELALRRMLDRFSDRFRRAESDGPTPLESLTPEEWDARWQRAKTETA